MTETSLGASASRGAAVTVGAQDTTVVWVLGQGSSASQPWGPKKNVIQTLLAHS